jgi:hypothetical protein
MAENGFSGFSHLRADFFGPQTTEMTQKQGLKFFLRNSAGK